MVLRTHAGGRVVKAQEATWGWDGDDEEEEEDEADWLWGEDEDEDEECAEGGDAPDGGWGWVVAGASFVIFALASMFANCFGVLFSGFLMTLHTSSTKVSEIFNLAFALSSFFSFLTGPLVEQFGWRRVTFVTSIVYSLGLASSAVATSASYYFVFTVMAAGLCISLLEVIAQHTVSFYFTDKRRLATCIVTLGGCATQMILTPLITYLQGEYSHRGATLIMAALTLNCCVAAMFLHPVEWHQKRPTGYSEDCEKKRTLSPPSSPFLSPLKSRVSDRGSVLQSRDRKVGYADECMEKGSYSSSLSPLSSPLKSTDFDSRCMSVEEHKRERKVEFADGNMEKGSHSPSVSPLISPLKSTVSDGTGFHHTVEEHTRERKVGFADEYMEKGSHSPSVSPFKSPLKSTVSDGTGFHQSVEEHKRERKVGFADEYMEKGSHSPSVSPFKSPLKSTVSDGTGFHQSVEEHKRERKVGFADEYMEKGSPHSPPLSPSGRFLRPAQTCLRNLRDERENQDEVEKRDLSPRKPASTRGGFPRLAQASFRNLRYIRSPRIALTSMILGLNVSSLVNIWAIVPFALKADGYSSQDVALCLSVAGLCNMASRFTNGVMSCWPTFTVQRLFIIGSAMSALGIIGFSWVDSLAWKTALFGVCGLGGGTISTLYSLVAVEAEGLHMHLAVLSLAGLVTGLCFLLVDPLAGLVRDLSGSYPMCLGVLGGFLLASLALWLLMPAPAQHPPQRHHPSEIRPLVKPSKSSRRRFTDTGAKRIKGHQREI